jgi:hypothetical protein
MDKQIVLPWEAGAMGKQSAKRKVPKGGKCQKEESAGSCCRKRTIWHTKSGQSATGRSPDATGEWKNGEFIIVSGSHYFGEREFLVEIFFFLRIQPFLA